MNGLEFRVNLIQGQKTGIFLDQRENYLRGSKICPRRQGARLLHFDRWLRAAHGAQL